jgi:hypothetical protein
VVMEILKGSVIGLIGRHEPGWPRGFLPLSIFHSFTPHFHAGCCAIKPFPHQTRPSTHCINPHPHYALPYAPVGTQRPGTSTSMHRKGVSHREMTLVLKGRYPDHRYLAQSHDSSLQCQSSHGCSRATEPIASTSLEGGSSCSIARL